MTLPWDKLVNIGVTTTVLGIGIVFAVLVILAICMSVLSRVVDGPSDNPRPTAAERRASRNVAPPASAASTANVVAEQPQAAPATGIPAAIQEGIPPKTVVAIVAAICAATGQSAENLKFTSIRRKDTVRYQWTDSSRAQMMMKRDTYF